MKFFIGQKLVQRFLQSKYDVPVLFYSSLQPSMKNANSQNPRSPPSIGGKDVPLQIKPKKEPFLKNILIGKFDTEWLSYPEFNTENLKHLSYQMESLYKEKHMRTGSSEIESPDLSTLKMPNSYDGLNFSMIECARIAETFGNSASVISYLTNQIIAQKTLATGSNEVKDIYSKEIVESCARAAVCWSEHDSEFDILKCKTTISWSDELGKHVLNGQKIWVANADMANFFIVLGHLNQRPAVLVLDKRKSGITLDKHKEDGYFSVDFKETPIDESEIISRESHGLETAYKIQRLLMFHYSSAVLGMVKDVFQQTVQLITYRPLLEQHVSDFEPAQITIASLASDIYALESMLYFTSNLIDDCEHQDCEVEVAVLKLFASNVSYKIITKCINLLGPHATMHSHDYPFMKTLETFKRLSQLNFSDDLVKSFISIKCIGHCKKDLVDYIRKVRNPYIYFNDALKHSYYILKNSRDSPKLDLFLHQNVHPSLKKSADSLEYCLKRLEYANVVLLQSFAAETFNHHHYLHHLTNVISDIFAMTCVLGRASGAVNSEIQSSDLQVTCARSFCQTALKNVKFNIDEVLQAENDEIGLLSKKLSKKMFTAKKYIADHPLGRNIM